MATTKPTKIINAVDVAGETYYISDSYVEDNYLPLTAGSEKPVTGTLTIKAGGSVTSGLVVNNPDGTAAGVKTPGGRITVGTGGTIIGDNNGKLTLDATTVEIKSIHGANKTVIDGIKVPANNTNETFATVGDIPAADTLVHTTGDEDIYGAKIFHVNENQYDFVAFGEDIPLTIQYSIDNSNEAIYITETKNGNLYRIGAPDKVIEDGFADLTLPSASGTFATEEWIENTSTVLHTTGKYEEIHGPKEFYSLFGSVLLGEEDPITVYCGNEEFPEYKDRVMAIYSNDEEDSSRYYISINDAKDVRAELMLPDESGTFATREWVQEHGSLSDLITEITYAELRELRDNGELIPGMQYRITDYVTTTTQFDTRSAGHQFDIIVTADSTNTLNENARAAVHKGDDYFGFAGSPTVVAKRFIDEWEGEEHEFEYDTWTYPSVFDHTGYLEDGTPVVYINNLDNVEKGTEDEFTDYYKYVGRETWNDIECDVWQRYSWGLADDNPTHYPSESYVLTTRTIVGGKFTGLQSGEKYKLSAWEIKYSIDNDADKFGWADDSFKKYKVLQLLDPRSTISDTRPIYYMRYPKFDDTENNWYAWVYLDTSKKHIYEITENDLTEFDQWEQIFLKSEFVRVGDQISVPYYGRAMRVNEVGDVTTSVREGKGVIYYMKDEWGNECPYDFKNIQFKRYKVADCSRYGEASSLHDQYLGIIGSWNEDILSIEDESDYIWCYTFYNNFDGEMRDISLNPFDYNKYERPWEQGIYTCNSGVSNNIIKPMHSNVNIYNEGITLIKYEKKLYRFNFIDIIILF